jgi:Lysine methyltransferase
VEDLVSLSHNVNPGFDIINPARADTSSAAMPEMTRTWIVPASADLPEIRFDIREPPLTGDNLGLKTWGTSYVIAKKLEDFGIQSLDHLFTKSRSASASPSIRTLHPERKVLELGAGTGLVGVAAGALWGADVYLTDLADIADNLLFNIDKNAVTVKEFGGNISGGVLDWREPDKAREAISCKRFDVSPSGQVSESLADLQRLSLLLILSTMMSIQHSLRMCYKNSSRRTENPGLSWLYPCEIIPPESWLRSSPSS